MLDWGVDIDFRSEEYECLSPLSCAIIHDRTAIAKLLLERGADPHIKPLGDWQEFTPLYIAALLGRTEVVQARLDHGVGTNGMDGNGKFPQCHSLDEFFEQITDLSMTNYEDWSEGIYCDSNCCVPLCAASMMGREDVVRTLLDHGANPNLPDPDGDFALGCAAKFGHKGIVRLLLERGAHIDLADSESTALGWDWSDGGIPAAIALLEAGADQSLVCEGDEYLILHALDYGHADGRPCYPLSFLTMIRIV